jgi:hypothetical protein
MPVKTDLFKAMKSSENYLDDEDILEAIEEMRKEVLEGADPEEVLRNEGFEPDYIFDIMDL